MIDLQHPMIAPPDDWTAEVGSMPHIVIHIDRNRQKVLPMEWIV